MKRINCLRRSERGTQIAEFALVLPLLVLLALVVTEGASVVRTHLILNNAAREGARLASSEENSPPCNDWTNNACKTKLPDLRAAVVAYASRNGVSATQCSGFGTSSVDITQVEPVTVTIGATPTEILFSRVRVDCSYTFRLLPRVGAAGTALNLRGEARFRNLYQ